MRPPAQRQSALRTPLNNILGTEGAVRLLRVLTAERAPMSAGILAQRARLNRSAARRVLGALLETGLVDVQGVGKTPHYALRQAHPLAPAVMALYEAERRRAEAVLDGIKKVVRQLTPPPNAVWLEGAVATETDEPGEPILVRVIDSARGLRETLGHLRQALEPLEQSFDVTIEVAGATPADLGSHHESGAGWEMRLRNARSLAGLPPAAFLRRPTSQASAEAPSQSSGRVRSHADLDERALALAGAIARRLRQDPTLVVRAREFVERRLSHASPQERHELQEWAQILGAASPARIRRFLLDRGERATRLRQTFPFLGVLTPEEREALLENYPTEPPSGVDA